MQTILIILIVLLLLGAFPLHGINPHYGYGMGGLGGILIIVLIVLVIAGR